MQMRKRKWDSLASGEELFGLPVTLYPGLENTERELSMLNRLYSCAPIFFIFSGGYCVFWVLELGKTLHIPTKTPSAVNEIHAARSAGFWFLFQHCDVRLRQ